MPSSPVRSSLWRDRDFRSLWLGQTVSQFGEHTTLVALPLIAVLTLEATPSEVGVLRSAGQVPILVLSLLVGAWVDGWRARTVMVLADLGRAVVLGGAALAGAFGWLGLPVLLLVALTVGALSVFFDVAYQTSLIRFVSREHLVQGNSALEGSRSAAQIGAPALGGALVSLFSAPIAAASSALFFVLSFLAIRRMRTAEPPRRRAGEPLWRRIRAGLRFVISDGRLRAVCLASSAFQFFFAAVMTVYLLYLPRELHLPGTVVGLVLAAAGPGALLGSVLAAKLPGRFGYGRVLIAAAVLGDGVYLCVPIVPEVPVLFAASFLFGAGGQLVNVTIMTIRQAATPDSMQGRIAATITFAGMGLTPLGSLFGGFVATGLTLRTSLVVTAAGMLLSPVVMALSPLAGLGRTLPPRAG